MTKHKTYNKNRNNYSSYTYEKSHTDEKTIKKINELTKNNKYKRGGGQMVKIMLASHGNLAAGMLSSAEMVFGKQDNVSVICAYVDGEDDVSTRIKGFIDSIAPDDSWIIFTDLFGGSVNNEFMKYISNPQIRLIAGMNLALVITAMSISEMKNNAAEVEEELLGIADSVINFCSRTGIDSLEDDEF